MMLVPTELDTIQSLTPVQLPESADLQASKEATPEQAMEQLYSFVHAHPDSPLTLEMYPYVFRAARPRSWTKLPLTPRPTSTRNWRSAGRRGWASSRGSTWPPR